MNRGMDYKQSSREWIGINTKGIPSKVFVLTMNIHTITPKGEVTDEIQVKFNS